MLLAQYKVLHIPGFPAHPVSIKDVIINEFIKDICNDFTLENVRMKYHFYNGSRDMLREIFGFVTH